MPERTTDLKFRGVDAAECEAFISAVTVHALSEGKQHDDQWMADFASGCFTQVGLRWWDSLDQSVQRSWKLLRRAMLSRFNQLTFSGQSAEEAETFVRMVRQKAFDEGMFRDNDWITAFASTCLVGDAMRWHASIDPAVQNDWRLLWPALLAQYTRDGPSGLPPATSAKIRARIQVHKKAEKGPIWYISKRLCPDTNEPGRLMLTPAAVEALEVEYNPLATKSQTLHIPDNQISGCDLLAIRWYRANTLENLAGLCGVNSISGSGTPGKDWTGSLSTNTWEISLTANGKGVRSLFVLNGSAHLFPLSNLGGGNYIRFRAELKEGEAEADFFLEPV